MAVSSGKWYWEGFTDTTSTPSLGYQFGFCQVGPADLTTPYGTGKYTHQDNAVYFNGSSANIATSTGANDLIAYALDMDAGTCKLYVNNSLKYTFTGITGTITPFVGSYSTPTVTVNFGQRPFAYTPPTGHVSLCTTNLPDPTIADGSTAFDAITYTGNGSAQTISGLGFSPDLVWSKIRSSTGKHRLTDIVRGTANALRSDGTDAEFTDTNVTAFNSDGFDIGANGNASGSTYVGWTWDAGSSNTSISVGGLNSSVYDQSQRWRNYLTSSNGFTANYGANKAFNGVFDADGGAATGGANATLTFTPPAMTVTSLEVNCYGNVTITLPDGTTRSVTGSGTIDIMRTVDVGSGFSFTGSNSIVFTAPTGHYTYLEEIKINGKELIDDDVSVTNVPSIPSTCLLYTSPSPRD